MSKIQCYATADSPPTDPLESIVEVYYQLKGYITSSNKWFWCREEHKKQRGYQDIDTLAVNQTDTVIVSVTANLDDKCHCPRRGSLCLDDLNKYFDRVQKYLQLVPQYHWLVDNGRTVRKVIAFASGQNLAERIRERLNEQQIELLSIRTIITESGRIIAEQKRDGLRTNNQLVKIIAVP